MRPARVLRFFGGTRARWAVSTLWVKGAFFFAEGAVGLFDGSA